MPWASTTSASSSSGDRERHGVARARRACRGVPAGHRRGGANRGAADAHRNRAGGGRRSGLHARPGREVHRPRMRRVAGGDARAGRPQGRHGEGRTARRRATCDGRGARRGRGGDRLPTGCRVAVPARACLRRPRRADDAPAPHGLGRRGLRVAPRLAGAARARPPDARAGRGRCAGIPIRLRGYRTSVWYTLDFNPDAERRSAMEETAKIWMNGELVDWADATVHVGVHGLHYGTGVFEGIRAYETAKGPAVFRLGDHMQRLHDSARLLYMELPYSVEDLRTATHDLVRANGLPAAYIRPIAFFGYGSLGVHTRGNPVETVIMSWPWGAYLGEDSH